MNLIECKFPCKMEPEEMILPSLNDIHKIYGRIMDEHSKEIFSERLLSSLTGDALHIRKMIRSLPAFTRLEQILHDSVYIYGAGARCQRLLDLYRDKQWKGIIDANKTGEIEGISICRLEDIKNVADAMVVISIKEGYQSVYEQLVSLGIKKDKIIILQKLIEETNAHIYFEKYCLQESKSNGLFLDVGCFDGTDSIRAIQFFSNISLQIYAFEPSKKNYRICKDRLSSYENITVFPHGISDKRRKVRFNDNGGASSIMEDGVDEIETVTIDEIVCNGKVGFIKMDIEGTEEKALEGAARVIREDMPVLAISIYHKQSDIWRIPLKILELNPNYKFYLGHYKMSWDDTVLYAVRQ